MNKPNLFFFMKTIFFWNFDCQHSQLILLYSYISVQKLYLIFYQYDITGKRVPK